MSVAVRRALYGKMAGDSTLTNLLGVPASGYSKSIYYQEAPAAAAFPFVLMSKQASLPTQAMNDPSIMDDEVWLLKAVDRSPSADGAENIQARLIALLNDASLSISGSTLLYLRRSADIDYPEAVDGVLYHHAGSLFRLVVT